MTKTLFTMCLLLVSATLAPDASACGRVGFCKGISDDGTPQRRLTWVQDLGVVGNNLILVLIKDESGNSCPLIIRKDEKVNEADGVVIYVDQNQKLRCELNAI